jgi:two-component system C4-dicarboxylate transport response regulator DctD
MQQQPQQQQPKSILVIDDDADITRVIKRSLQQQQMQKGFDYDVKVFNDSQNALEYFKTNPNNILAIITDIRIPGMSGLDLLSRVKKINPDVKVFLITGFDIDMIQPEVDSLDLDIIQVFQKPLFDEGMSKKVIEHLQSKT